MRKHDFAQFDLKTIPVVLLLGIYKLFCFLINLFSALLGTLIQNYIKGNVYERWYLFQTEVKLLSFSRDLG